MLDSITVGVACDSQTDAAALIGAEMAQKLGARLDLVHASAIEVPVWSRVPPSHWVELTAKAEVMSRTACREHLVSLLGEVGGRSVEDMLSVVVGKPAEALLRFTQEHDTKLLVLGGSRHQAWYDFRATARVVLGSSPCPVWVQTEPVKTIRRILVPVDQSPNSDAALVFARDLAEKLEATLEVHHSFRPSMMVVPHEDGGLDLEAMRKEDEDGFLRYVDEFDGRGVPVVARFTSGNPAEDILRLQDEVDLIVMGTHGRSGLVRAVLGSNAYRVTKEAKVGVVVVPMPERKFLTEAYGS